MTNSAPRESLGRRENSLSIPAFAPLLATHWAVKFVMGSSLASLLLQLGGQDGSNFIDHVGRVTLDGALIIAVGVLWRSLSSERLQSLRALETATVALVSTSDSNKELRKIIEEMRRAIDDSVYAKKELTLAIDALRHSCIAINSTRTSDKIIT